MAREAEKRIRDLVHSALAQEPHIYEAATMETRGQRLILHFKNFDDIEIRVRQLKGDKK